MGEDKLQAVGKVLSDKPAIIDAIINSLAQVWCPFKGIECKDLGMNRFLFTFHEEAGKTKALNNGPWIFNKSLVVVHNFNPAKSLDEYELKHTPIWVRVYGIPMGSMSRESGEDIRREICQVLDVDVDNCDMAMGEYMRIKVRMDITKPLMRGITIFVDEEDENKEEDEENIITEDEENKKE